MAVQPGTGSTKLLQIADAAVSTVERRGTTISVIGWIGFAAVCADYARILDLPTLLAVPLWAAAIVSFFRWAIWEGFLKERVVKAIDAARSSDGGGA